MTLLIFFLFWMYRRNHKFSWREKKKKSKSKTKQQEKTKIFRSFKTPIFIVYIHSFIVTIKPKLYGYISQDLLFSKTTFQDTVREMRKTDSQLVVALSRVKHKGPYQD